jgi:hypothetical protein
MLKLKLTVVLLASSQAFGAFTYRASAKIPLGGANQLIDTSSADLIVVSVTDYYNNASWGWGEYNVGGNNTWIQASVQGASGGVINRLMYTLHPAHVGTSHGFYVAYSTSITIAAYSGSAASSVDLITGNATSAATVQPGAILPVCTNELIVFSMGGHGAGAPTISGATLRQSLGFSGESWANGLADSIQTSPLSINPTWTNPGSANSVAVAVSFKAADSVCGGGTTAVRHRVMSGGD